MSAFWSHPLTVAVIGSGIIALLVQQLTRWWQDQRTAWEVRVSLVTAMSETTMDLMARFRSTLGPESSEENTRASNKLDDARQEFAVKKAVVGTKLEAYLGSPTSVESGGDSSPSIADRWNRLADAMTNLVDLKKLDTARDGERRGNLLAGLTEAMAVLAQAERPGTCQDGKNPEEVLRKVCRHMEGLGDVSAGRVNGQAWCDALDAVLERKRVLVVEVRDARMAFRTPWLPWRSGAVRTTRRNKR